MASTNTFQKLTGFCTDCGSILPPLGPHGNIKCYTCSKAFPPQYLIEESTGSSNAIEYTIYFNSKDMKSRHIIKQEKDGEGPVVERKCPKCGNEKMSYATLQLRSADEGQTVFYTCTKCKYKESENS